jgi:hypothetical protein
MVKMEKMVRTKDLVEKRTTSPEKATAIPADPKAARRMDPFVSYHQKLNDMQMVSVRAGKPNDLQT